MQAHSRRYVAVVSAGVLFALAITAAPAAPRYSVASHVHKLRARPGCPKLFTPRMGERAALRIYSGTRDVPQRGLRTLGYIERCQRDPHDQVRVTAFDHARQAEWYARRHPPPMNVSTASWYDDAGSTASGFHSYYGVADCGSGGGPCYGFGTRIQFCYPVGSSRCVVATVDDHGPYIAGRAWDLNQNVAGALGFSGVDSVAWRVVG